MDQRNGHRLIENDGLYEYAVEQKGVSIGDLEAQLEFFLIEYEEYSTKMPDYKEQGGGEQDAYDAAITFHDKYEQSNDTPEQKARRGDNAVDIYSRYSGTVPMANINFNAKKKAMAVTDREVSEENEFQGAIKLKRVLPDKDFGELSEVDGNIV